MKMSLEEAANLLKIDLNNATPEELRSARRLVLHNMDFEDPGQKENIQRVNVAFDTLKNQLSDRKNRNDTLFLEEKSEEIPVDSITEIDAKIEGIHKEFIRVFKREQREIIEEGPFNKEDLQAFYAKYQKMKEDLNGQLVILKAEKERLKAPLALPDKTEPVLSLPDKSKSTLQIEDKSEPILGLPDKLMGGKESDGKKLPSVISTKTVEDFMFSSEDRGFYQIIDDLTHGLGIKKDDHKKLRASNIKVKESFKQELSSGNYLYNVVHFIPTILKLPVQLFMKAKNRIMSNKETQQRIETLKERVNQLSERDVKTIWNNYRNERVIQEKYPTVLNDLLNKKMYDYAMENVSKLNEQNKKHYLDIFCTCRKVDLLNESLQDPNLTPADREKVEQARQIVLEGKAEVIKAIRDNKREADQYLSSGLAGFDSDMKAAASKMNYVGRRFAKTYDMDEELAAKQAKLEKEENYAIRTGNDEMAFNAFVNSEMLLSENTEIKKTIFGKLSSGKKDYSPLAKMLNRNPDTFVRDVFTSLAVTGAVMNVAGGIMARNANQDILAHQRSINTHNEKVMADVHKAGEDITGQSDTFVSGMRAQVNQAVNDASGTIERSAIDKNNWAVGSSQYHMDDAIGHEYYNGLYQNTENAFADIVNKYSAGEISQGDALNSFNEIANQTQANLNEVYTACKPIMEEYAKNHSSFDLAGSLKTIDYLVQNPTAIMDMNNAIVDTVQIGETLGGLNFEQVEVFSELPSDLATTLIGATATAALAMNVAGTMNANEKAGKYGDEVTDMVAEYVASKNEKNVDSINISKAA